MESIAFVLCSSSLLSQICVAVLLFCTFGDGGGPGDDAPHKTAVEQEFLGEAMVLQVLPPLSPLGW